jgi:hypothetical protein
MAKGRSGQNPARDGDGRQQRLAVAESEKQGEQTADKITAEDPRIEFGGRQASLRCRVDVDKEGAGDRK